MLTYFMLVYVLTMLKVYNVEDKPKSHSEKRKRITQYCIFNNENIFRINTLK